MDTFFNRLEEIQYFLDDEFARFIDSQHFIGMNQAEMEVAEAVNKAIASKGFANRLEYPPIILDLIPKFVREEIWFYQAGKQIIKANSESIRWAIRKFLKAKPL